jgi:hypothetical protein
MDGVNLKLDNEENEFENWAQSQIKKYSASGKDTNLLVKELLKIQKNN